MRPHPKSKRRYRRDRLRISNKERRARRPGSGIGWLTRAIFSLFPPMDWKSLPILENVPLTNKGIIWSAMNPGPTSVYPYDPSKTTTLEEMAKTLAAADKDYRDRLKTHKPFPGSGEIVLGGSAAGKSFRMNMAAVPGLDIFEINDPTPYGYTLSEDIRAGILPVQGLENIGDVYRGMTEQYPKPNPTVRITDAKTGEQYYPTRILTPKSHNAMLIGLVDEFGNDLTKVWSIVYYDMGTGEMRYYDRPWTGPDLDHPKTGIFPDLKIVMKS